ncbi:MAG: dCTP deaminase [Aeropyrum sp.]|nr:dCTP deaminase [Aeropyrum sp.]MCE4616508.1 dCTP deaminase [Aeropyrum sp.]
MILSDRDIEGLLALGELVVDPLAGDSVRENGLDLRLGRGYCRFRPTGRVLDPRSPGDPGEFYECGEGDEIVVRPLEHILLHTVEYIRLPPYVAGLVNLRSTWARTGLYIPATVVDAGFEGQLTIEVVGSSFPVKLYPGDRFLHLVLVRLNTPARKPYSGRYQGQRGVKIPKIFTS